MDEFRRRAFAVNYGKGYVELFFDVSGKKFGLLVKKGTKGYGLLLREMPENMENVKVYCSGWVEVGDPDDLLSGKSAEPIREMLRWYYPDTYEDVLKGIVGCLKVVELDNAFSLADVIEESLSASDRVKVRPPIDFHPSLGVVFMIPLSDADNSRWILVCPSGAELIESDGDAPFDRKAVEWCDVSRTHRNAILKVAREIAEGKVRGKGITRVS